MEPEIEVEVERREEIPVETELPQINYYGTSPRLNLQTMRWEQYDDFKGWHDTGIPAVAQIGENGNWFITGLDTGMPSRGKQGLPGIPGPQGEPGIEGQRGIPGKDGVSPRVTVIPNALGNTVKIKDEEGEKQFFVPNGATGPAGPQGERGIPGNGIVSIRANPDYSITITMEDGTKYTTDYLRGPTGPVGPPGPPGIQGETGRAFQYEDFTEEQLEGLKVRGDQGPAGPAGPEGPRGPQGEQYILTDADKEEIAQQAAEKVPPYDDNEIKEDLSQLFGRVKTVETALIGVDAAITRLEAAV